MRAKKFKKLLKKNLGYEVVRQKGSHCTLRAEDYPDLRFAFHDGATLGPVMIREILVNQVGLTLEEAKEVYRHG